MKDFLSTYGLNKKYLVHENYIKANPKLVLPHDFVGLTFDYKCEFEEKNKTFELNLSSSEHEYYSSFNELKDEQFKNDNLSYSFKVIGKCTSCKNYHIEFLLHLFSDNPIPKRLIVGRFPIGNSTGTMKSPKLPVAKLYIEKIGAWPPIRVTPDKLISKHFDRESNLWYYKGINCIQENYGIGAYAYFRRIVEKELINIINDIKELPSSHTSEIENLLKAHNNSPNVSTIYDNIFQHLPESLKALGDNPIKLLYKETSEGLHNLTEDECLKKAEIIKKVLEFVFKKIKEEKSEIKNLRDLIKSLK